MDRNSLLRIAGFAIVAFLFMKFVWPGSKSSEAEVQPIPQPTHLTPKDRLPEQLCTMHGPRFEAILSTQDATLKHAYITGEAKYTVDGSAASPPLDLVTTPDHEELRPLRFTWRAAQASSQVDYDDFDWSLKSAAPDGSSCVFSYEDDKVALTKEIKTDGRPFELMVKATIQNKLDHAAKHHAAGSSRLTAGTTTAFTAPAQGAARWK